MNLTGLVQINTAGASVLAAAMVIVAVIKYLKFRLALKDTKPSQRPAIIKSLVPMFKRELPLASPRRRIQVDRDSPTEDGG